MIHFTRIFIGTAKKYSIPLVWWLHLPTHALIEKRKDSKYQRLLTNCLGFTTTKAFGRKIGLIIHFIRNLQYALSSLFTYTILFFLPIQHK